MSPSLSRRAFLAAGGAVGGAANVLGATVTAGAPRPASATNTMALVLDTEVASDGRYGVVIKERRTRRLLARLPSPMQIMAKVGDHPVDTSAGYDRVIRRRDGFDATGTVTTPAGSSYAFTDQWTVQDDAVLVHRQVQVATAATTLEMGFNSRFALGTGNEDGLAACEVFLPGVRYGDTTGLPDGAIGGSDTDDYAYVRAMRLTLPFVALRHRSGGPTLTLSHHDARPITNRDGFVDERSSAWWINSDIQYASLGSTNGPAPS